MKATDADASLLALARAVTAISLHAAAGIGEVSIVQLRALTVLSANKVTNLKTLAESLGVTDSTASRLVDRLIAASLINRRTATHSRREVSLRLTRSGHALVNTYDALRLQPLHAALSAVDAEKRAELLKWIAAFSAAAGQSDSVTTPTETAKNANRRGPDG